MVKVDRQHRTFEQAIVDCLEMLRATPLVKYHLQCRQFTNTVQIDRYVKYMFEHGLIDNVGRREEMNVTAKGARYLDIQHQLRDLIE